MTNEELERVTRSITEWQEVAAKNIAEITRTQAEHAETQAERDERIKRFERSYSTITDLLQRHDAQLVAVTDNSNNLNEVVANLAISLAETNAVLAITNATVDRLSATVDRYITARSNNGSNGASDN